MPASLYLLDKIARHGLAARDAGEQTITLNIKAIEEVISNGDGPAYRLMKAMASVIEHEGHEGYRGAPRLTLALLKILEEQR